MAIDAAVVHACFLLAMDQHNEQERVGIGARMALFCTE